MTAHSDAGFNNEKKRDISENETIPHWNGPILTIAQIMKYVLSSAAEAEMGALFLTEK